MKYSKIIIETDGTSIGTKVLVDGKQLELVQNLDFSCNVDEVFARLNIQVACKNSVSKKIKVRDLKTEKFVDKEKLSSIPLILERKN
ncbi:MAG: hypothetical protein PHF86_07625 [Candidatus Nanoarchaeia archaeon]|jgi:hypothetical protein|nr:hypothetical protein [Candidatus Nanoarchaeia archaeon]